MTPNTNIEQQLLQWSKQICQNLWTLDNDHITIDIMIVDGTYIRYAITHETLGMTEYASSIEDAQRLIASAKKQVARPQPGMHPTGQAATA
jgi:hypothetical protein